MQQRLISSLALAFLVSSSGLLVVGFCHDSSFCGAHVLRVEHVESKDVKNFNDLSGNCKIANHF